MSPDVLKGDINLANPTMDIWALGIMMFLMIFGFHPFITKEERISKQFDVKVVMQRIINDPLVIPYSKLQKQDEEIEDEEYLFEADRDTENFNIPLITEECRDLLQRLLEKNPKERI